MITSNIITIMIIIMTVIVIVYGICPCMTQRALAEELRTEPLPEDVDSFARLLSGSRNRVVTVLVAFSNQ